MIGCSNHERNMFPSKLITFTGSQFPHHQRYNNPVPPPQTTVLLPMQEQVRGKLLSKTSALSSLIALGFYYCGGTFGWMDVDAQNEDG